MKKLIILILMAVFTVQINTAVAQELSKKELRKIEKAEKKQRKKEQRKENKAANLQIIKDQSFVIEANTIQGRNLYTHQVSSNTNFIKVEGQNFVLQTASNFGFGYNGLGGITIVGKIADFEVTEGKEDKAIRISAQVNSPVLGHSTVFMTISGSGNGTARLTDNWGNRITFNGEIYPLENSSIYQGQSIM
jgi:hypothetical protein